MKKRHILSVLALVSISMVTKYSFAKAVNPNPITPGNPGNVIVEPDLPPESPSEPFINVSKSFASSPALRVDYSCGKGRNKIYRTKPQLVSRVKSPSLTRPISDESTKTIEIEPCQTLYFDTNLEPETTYCYRIEADDGNSNRSAQSCMKTPFQRVEFKQSSMTIKESQAVINAFHWFKTDPVPEKIIGSKKPYLYHMNVLIENSDQITDLQHIGIHVQNEPIFNNELSSWSGNPIVARKDEEIIGTWVFAIVPGAMYNEIRQQSIDAIINNEQPPLKALVFRKIPVAQASRNYNDKHQLAYRYLGEQGLEFNGVSSKGNCSTFEGREVCSQPLIGHYLRKFTDWAYSVGEDLVDVIRGSIGSYKRLVNGEISLSLQFHLLNTDNAFGLDRVMHSGWRDEELFLEGVRVHVRQGLASFFGTTDNEGRTTIRVAKNQNTKICIEAQNRYASLTSFIGRTINCVENIGKLTTDTAHSTYARNSRLNVLAQITDTALYMKTVSGYNMKKISVLVGGWADTFSTNGRSFVPCMGRTPSLLGAYADMLGLINPLLIIPSAVAEFLSTYDMVMPTDDLSSRGIATHEYGHAIMCDLLINESMVAFQTVWTDVILSSASQTADDHASVIAEAFADYISSQVIGGTNYFTTVDSTEHGGINYCDALSGTGSESCLEVNYTASDTNSPSERVRFTESIRHLTSLMHDAFDGHVEALQPNDASHWSDQLDGVTLLPSAGNYTDSNDDVIALEGAALKGLFKNWVKGGYNTQKMDFINALLETMTDSGYSRFSQCSLINLHNSNFVNDCSVGIN